MRGDGFLRASPAELAKDLTARNGDVEWRDLIEIAFTEAIRAHREGEPAIALPDVPARIAPRYALQPLALQELLTVAWSRPGEGKTWLACAAAAALQTGRGELLGLAPARPLRVGILDWEDDAFTKAERVAAIAGAPVPSIVYVACRAAIWDELDRLMRIVRQHELEYLVVDSLGMACGGLPPESSEAALRCGTAMRRLGLGIFATAHLTKNGVNESAPFGSIFWLAQLRLGWLLKREQGASESGFTLGLFCKKSNNDQAPAPIGYDVAFASGRTTFRRRDVRDVPELEGGLPLRQRILAALRSGPADTVEGIPYGYCNMQSRNPHASAHEPGVANAEGWMWCTHPVPVAIRSKLYKEFGWLWWWPLADSGPVTGVQTVNVFVNSPCQGNLNYRIVTVHGAQDMTTRITQNTQYVVCQ